MNAVFIWDIHIQKLTQDYLNTIYNDWWQWGFYLNWFVIHENIQLLPVIEVYKSNQLISLDCTETFQSNIKQKISFRCQTFITVCFSKLCRDIKVGFVLITTIWFIQTLGLFEDSFRCTMQVKTLRISESIQCLIQDFP